MSPNSINPLVILVFSLEDAVGSLSFKSKKLKVIDFVLTKEVLLSLIDGWVDIEGLVEVDLLIDSELLIDDLLLQPFNKTKELKIIIFLKFIFIHLKNSITKINYLIQIF